MLAAMTHCSVREDSVSQFSERENLSSQRLIYFIALSTLHIGGEKITKVLGEL